jgi:hypothetical protein
MGSRRKRRERYLSVIMDILKDGEWHSLHDLAYEVKLTTSEVTGLLRGEAVVRDSEKVKLGDTKGEER